MDLISNQNLIRSEFSQSYGLTVSPSRMQAFNSFLYCAASFGLTNSTPVALTLAKLIRSRNSAKLSLAYSPNAPSQMYALGCTHFTKYDPSGFVAALEGNGLYLQRGYATASRKSDSATYSVWGATMISSWTIDRNSYVMVFGVYTLSPPNPIKSPWKIRSVWGRLHRQHDRISSNGVPPYHSMICSWVSHILIFFLLKTDLVPTKKLPVAGLVPHTIAGAPSILTDKRQTIKKASNTVRSPVRMLSSGCSMWVFFILL